MMPDASGLVALTSRATSFDGGPVFGFWFSRSAYTICGFFW
jgi:hypothetical protein